MAVRFRIRTSAGQELSFASRETFEDFVRSGDLSPDDLVYDGETGSWSPARTHPTVLEIEYEREADAEAGARDERAVEADAGPEVAAESDVGSESEEPAASDDFASFDLDLAPAEERTPDQEARAFVEKMEAERETDLLGGTGRIEGFTMQDSATLSDMLEPAPPPEPPASPVREPVRPPVQRQERPPRRREESGREERGRRGREGAEPMVAEASPGGGRRLLTALLLLAVLGGGAYAAYALLTPPPASEPVSAEVEGESEVPVDAASLEPVPEPTPPAREPVIAATETAVRERAQERFLTATQTALRDLQPVPDAWASGPYLVVPSDHPEVVDVWQSYLATVRRVRADEPGRYRAAYVAALDDAAVEGEARGTRLAAAMTDFTASAQVRSAHWDRVETLATAALQSHNALVEAEGLLLHDAGAAADGLGAGVSGRDADAQRLLRQVVELLSARLDADGLGPGDGGSVREWVWDGFLDAVTR